MKTTQAGRYREFVQCDFDTIGTESVAADIETALVIHELLVEIGIDRFQIRINNRQVLNGLLTKLNLHDHSVAVLRALDKLEKAGEEAVRDEMQRTSGITESQANEVLRLATIASRVQADPSVGLTGAESDLILDEVAELLEGVESGLQGVARLRTIVNALRVAGVPDDRFCIDVTIARGLDYYTGVVFETILKDLPSIGSVCSGGRYDNLAGLYTKQHLPGIGASLGLDRLIAALEQLNKLQRVKTPAQVFVPYFDATRLNDYIQLCQIVRRAGFNVEFYPDPKKLGVQLKYADDRGFALALIAGSEELDAGTCQVKNLKHKIATTVQWKNDVQPLLKAITDGMAMIQGTIIA